MRPLHLLLSESGLARLLVARDFDHLISQVLLFLRLRQLNDLDLFIQDLRLAHRLLDDGLLLEVDAREDAVAGLLGIVRLLS